jgi:8-oxo-dGTP pyrophosphatase MutT (NUDIX family)
VNNTSHDPRLGARLLLLDPDDRLLLIHAHDPHQPDHRWWELPGGGVQDGESAQDAAVREVTEETGYVPGPVGPLVWMRESRFCYQGRNHHRLDAIHLARIHQPHARRRPRAWTANEKTTVLGERWWTLDQLHAARGQRFLPRQLPDLLGNLLAGRQHGILQFYEDTRATADQPASTHPTEARP